jgi:hypothetical protein
VTDSEILAYVEARRAELEARRRAAPQQPIEWAAEGAIHELDRLEAVLRCRGRRALSRHLPAVEEDLEADVHEAGHDHPPRGAGGVAAGAVALRTSGTG